MLPVYRGNHADLLALIKKYGVQPVKSLTGHTVEMAKIHFKTSEEVSL